MLEMHIFGPQPRPPNPKLWGGAQRSVFTCPTGLRCPSITSENCSCLRTHLLKSTPPFRSCEEDATPFPQATSSLSSLGPDTGGPVNICPEISQLCNCPTLLLCTGQDSEFWDLVFPPLSIVKPDLIHGPCHRRWPGDLWFEGRTDVRETGWGASHLMAPDLQRNNGNWAFRQNPVNL